MSAEEFLVGRGQLAEFLRRTTEPVEGCVLVVAPGYAGAPEHRVLRRLVASSMPHLLIQIHHGAGLVGPFFLAPGTACGRCLEQRWLSTKDDLDAAGLRAYLESPAAASPVDNPWLHQAAHETFAALVTAELDRFRSDTQPLTVGLVYEIDLRTLAVGLYPAIRVPGCPTCGELPPDTAAAAEISCRARPKGDRRRLHLRELPDLAELGDLFNAETGLVRQWGADPESPIYCYAQAELGDASGHMAPGFGRAFSVDRSQVIAALEALERRAGLSPRAKRTTVEGSFRELAERALDPRRVGLYEDHLYGNPDFPCLPFDPERPLRWVWGYSFGRREPLLIPEDLVYYGGRPGHRPIVAETSNGCALGSCLEEAILHGLFEVVERDGFLMTWYGRLPLRPIDPYSTADPDTLLVLGRLETLGYEFHAFDMTLETGIPAILGVCRNRRDEVVRSIFAGDASLDPETSLATALSEVTGMLHRLRHRAITEAGHMEELVEEPARVRSLDDHALLYASPRMAPVYSFLLGKQEPMALKRVWPAVELAGDLRADLERCVEAVLHCGLDVLVVDQTSDEQRDFGLRVVKVLVPGMLPITFGSAMRRVRDLDRLYAVPAALGFPAAPRSVDELNPYPHPLP